MAILAFFITFKNNGKFDIKYYKMLAQILMLLEFAEKNTIN